MELVGLGVGDLMFGVVVLVWLEDSVGEVCFSASFPSDSFKASVVFER